MINQNNSSGAWSIIGLTGYKYDLASRRERATSEDGSYWDYRYNSRGEVTQAKRRLSNNELLAGQQFEYDFDDIRNRTKSRFGGDSTGNNLREINYTPNAVNQYNSIETPPYTNVLAKAQSSAVTVNSNTALRQGDYCTKELAFPSQNTGRLVDVTMQQGPTTKSGKKWIQPMVFAPEYDWAGNLTKDARFTYKWDAENRLVTVESLPHIPAAERRRVTCIYDHEARRLSCTVTHTNTNTILETTRYAYDGWNCIAEFSGTTNTPQNLTKTLTWGMDLSGTEQGAGGVGGLLQVKEAGQSYFPNYDGNGNVMSFINPSGAVVARYLYDAFGNEIARERAYAEQNKYRFSTKPIDAVTGLYYYGYRYYDPVTGRWPSRDPIEEEGGINLYGFFENQSVGKYDVLGRQTWGYIEPIVPNEDDWGRPFDEGEWPDFPASPGPGAPIPDMPPPGPPLYGRHCCSTAECKECCDGVGDGCVIACLPLAFIPPPPLGIGLGSTCTALCLTAKVICKKECDDCPLD